MLVRSEFQKNDSGGIVTNRGKERTLQTERPIREVVRGGSDRIE